MTKLALTYGRFGAILALFVVCLTARTPLAIAAVSATDSEGRSVVLPVTAKRIISLSPHITELLFAAGAGENIVGAVQYSDYPEVARNIKRIGSSGRVDMEALVSLTPDLVVAWTSGNATSDIAAIRRLGIPVFYSDPRRLKDIPLELVNLSRLSGAEQAAASSIRQFKNRHNKLIARYSGRSRRAVFFQLWHRPIMTVNRNHLIHDVIELCGGRNVFADSVSLTPVVGIEAVIMAKPEFVVSSNVGEADLFAMWQRWPGADVANKKNMVFVPADLLHRQGPRIIEGAEILCRGINQP